jgi:F0F1-type ATP synthase epsilon subunit
VAALGQGDVRILDAKGDKKIFNIKKGFIEVLKNEVSLLVQGVKE